MSSVTTAVHPDKESVYFQGSLTQMQARQYANINRDNVTFLEIVKSEPRKQSYTDTAEFDSIIGKYPFLSNKFIYKKVIDDARVIPDNLVMKNRMDEYFSPRFYKNLLRLYQNSPLYFDHLFSREGVADQRHKQYSVYIYTLCLIEYIMKHYDSNDFKLIDSYQLYYDWALPKYSEHISYIIKGPLSKSSSIKIDFKKHYATIMNPSNVEGDMTPVLQLASLQNLDSKLTQFFLMVSKMNNAYDKLKDEARTYNLVIRARNTKCYNDPLLNNTFVIDLRGSDFGETDYAVQSTASLNTTVTTSIDLSSRLSLHKLQELFTKYSRFRIVSLNVNRELYNVKLDTLDSVNIFIDGISMSSRTVNVINGPDSIDEALDSFNIPGAFMLSTNNIVKFDPFIDVTTYNPEKVRVTDARLYLIHNGKPLSAKLFNVTASSSTLYNVIYTKNANIKTMDKHYFIKPMIYSKTSTLVPERVSFIYDTDNTGMVSFSPIITKNLETAFNGGGLFMADSSAQTYTYTYAYDGTSYSVESNLFPTTAEELFDILDIDENTTLTNLNIKLCDAVGIRLNTNFTELQPDSYSYTSTLMALLQNARTVDSFTTFTEASIDDSATTPLGYGYYSVYHYRDNQLLEIHTATPNNMVIYRKYTNDLKVTISCKTIVQQTTIYLSYEYTGNYDEATAGVPPNDATYDEIPLTEVNILSNDEIFIYYYNPTNDTQTAYKTVIEVDTTPNATGYITNWYNSVVLYKNNYDLIEITGRYQPNTPVKISIINNSNVKPYSVTNYVPLLLSDHVTVEGAVLFTPIERLGFGNETLSITHANKQLYFGIPFISWEELTILLNMYMKPIAAVDNIQIGLENMDDIFNIQIEFS